MASKKDYNKAYKINNKISISKKAKEYYRKRKDKYKELHLKRTYNLTTEEYNKLFTLQEGKCKCCKTHQTEFKKALFVDHNHKTGEVRGLLCCNCNLAIGLVKEDINTLLEIIDYLTGVKK